MFISVSFRNTGRKILYVFEKMKNAIQLSTKKFTDDVVQKTNRPTNFRGKQFCLAQLWW